VTFTELMDCFLPWKDAVCVGCGKKFAAYHDRDAVRCSDCEWTRLTVEHMRIMSHPGWIRLFSRPVPIIWERSG